MQTDSPVRTVSAAQIRANRLNAQKSTGPKTAEGKIRASRNSLKYGLFSVNIAVPGEDRREYARFRIQYLRCFDPDNHLELQFVDQFILAAWKFRRLQIGEGVLYADRHNRILRRWTDPPECDPSCDQLELNSGTIMMDLLVADDGFDGVQRHERWLSNTMHRAMEQLRKMRKETGGGPTGMVGTLCEFTGNEIEQEEALIAELDAQEQAEHEAKTRSEAPPPPPETQNCENEPNSTDADVNPAQKTTYVDYPIPAPGHAEFPPRPGDLTPGAKRPFPNPWVERWAQERIGPDD